MVPVLFLFKIANIVQGSTRQITDSVQWYCDLYYVLGGVHRKLKFSIVIQFYYSLSFGFELDQVFSRWKYQRASMKQSVGDIHQLKWPKRMHAGYGSSV